MTPTPGDFLHVAEVEASAKGNESCHCGQPIDREGTANLCRLCKFSSCPQCRDKAPS